MTPRSFAICLPVLALLAGCSSNGTAAGGGGGGTGGGTGGSGPSTPASAALNASGTGTLAVRGLSTRFDKNVQLAAPVPGAPTIYESGFGGVFNYGGYNSFANIDAAQSGAVVEGTATFTNAGAAGATLNLQPGGTYVGGAAITAFNGTAGSAPLPGRGQGTNQRYDQSGGTPISSAAVSLDSIGTGGFDLAKIDLQTNQTNPTERYEEIGIYYGGTFASQAAVDAIPRTGSNTASFNRVANGSSADAGLFSVSPLDGIAGEDAEIYRGDVNLNLDFATNTVSGGIVNIRQADAGIGAAAKQFQLRYTGGTISGTNIGGGTLRVTNAAGTTLDQISASAVAGSFMGTNAETLTGVFQAQGSTSALAGSIGQDIGAPAGVPIFINGRMTGDR